MKIVIELLSIMSIATKEVRRRRASELSVRDTLYFATHIFSELLGRKLLGRTDIEDALKRLDSLIQEEFQMAMAQILQVTTEVKAGTRTYRPVTHITLTPVCLGIQQVSNDMGEVKRDVVEVRHGIVEVKHGVMEVKQDVVEVKQDVVEVKQDVVEVKCL